MTGLWLIALLAQPAPESAPPKEAAPKEAAPKEAAPKEAAPKEAAPKEAVPKEAAPKEAAPKEAAPAPVVPAFTPREIIPRTITEQRADAILLDSVVHEDAWWVQGGLMLSIYDPRRDLVAPRYSVGLSGGRRFSRYGFFGRVEFDQTLDFTLDTEFLNVMNVGVGLEYLNFLGHVRSSITVGAAILLNDTAIDDAGESGWFIDVRPAGLRWAMGDRFVFEFTPISLDIITPVPSGIPLIVYSYGTVLNIEWASR